MIHLDAADEETNMSKPKIISLPKPFYLKMIPTVTISGIMSIVSALFIRYQLNETLMTWQRWIEAAVIMTIAMVFQYYRNILPARDVFNAAFSIRKEVLEHMDHVKIQQLQKNNAGSWVSRLQGDIKNIQDHIGQDLWESIFGCIVSPLALIYAFSVSWKLAIINMATIPVTLILLGIFNMPLSLLTQKRQQAVEDINAYTVTMMGGLEDMKGYGQEEKMQKIYEVYSQKVCQTAIQNQKYQYISQAVSAFSGCIPIVALYAMGAMLVQQGEITSLEWFSYFVISEYTNGIFSYFPQLLTHIREIRVGEKRLLEMVQLPVEEWVEQCQKIKHDDLLVVQNLSYTYPTETTEGEEKARPALEDVSFSVKKGEKVVIVGKSGSGKSTLVSLLIRELLPTAGDIIKNGHSVFNTRPEEWRENIQLVSQEPFLFDWTIQENIVGSYTFSDERIEEAMGFSCLVMDAEAKLNLEECVGENGSRLSGGQKQRVALARAFYPDGELLILDEGTSALNAKLRDEIIDHVWKLPQSCILVTHQVDAYQKADRIIVLEQGHLVAQGTHKELLQKSDTYQNLMNRENIE